MTEKINLARIKKFGNNFEICVDPDMALRYKNGEVTDLREVLMADGIFFDAKKGLKASADKLMEAFKTDDPDAVADTILREGEIQATSEQRSAEREKLLRQLIDKIHKQAVDPKTGLPHPLTRIEAALEQGKISLDYNKSIEEQFDSVIEKLRPIIPIKIEQKKLKLTVPGVHAGKMYNWVKMNSKMLKEEWTGTGDWKVVVEVPAGFVGEYVDKLNSMTHGEVVVEIE